MSVTIKDPIEVVAVFDRGLRPVKFRWRGRVHAISEITYRWSSREGAASVLHFSVTDGAALYELACNTSTLRWTIERVEA